MVECLDRRGVDRGKESGGSFHICNTHPTEVIWYNICSFLGFANLYHQFIPNFSNVARPLLDLTKQSHGCWHVTPSLKSSKNFSYPNQCSPFPTSLFPLPSPPMPLNMLWAAYSYKLTSMGNGTPAPIYLRHLVMLSTTMISRSWTACHPPHLEILAILPSWFPLSCTSVHQPQKSYLLLVPIEP